MHTETMSTLWIQIALSCCLVGICKGQSESDCSKYCHKSCSDYFPGNEFSTCVNANVNCHCGDPPNEVHPIARAIMIIIGIAIVFMIVGICYKACRRQGSRGMVYPPVVPQIGQSYPTNSGAYSVAVPPGPTPYPTPYPNPGVNPYYNTPAHPASAPSPNVMQSGGLVDPPPSYGQAMVEPEPPGYTSKYSTYK